MSGCSCPWDEVVREMIKLVKDGEKGTRSTELLNEKYKIKKGTVFRCFYEDFPKTQKKSECSLK